MLRLIVRCVSALVFVLFVIVGYTVYDGYATATSPGAFDESRIVLIEPGQSLGSTAYRLESDGTIASSRIMRWSAKVLKRERLRAGEFEIPAASSIIDILKVLNDGPFYQRRITFAEGLSAKQIVMLLNEEALLSGDIAEVPAEGSLLPETYLFTRGEDRNALIARMQDAMDKALVELWKGRADGLPVDTPEEAVILASIVEKETGLAAERPLVAAVFTNRLRRRMRLQSDPTIIYGITQGEPLGRPIRRSELKGKTPYNTYVIRGLPPTPIANPGRSALAAVLNPAEAPYLYFVADGSGGHAFARTLAEHNDNVAAWRRWQRQNRDG